jgi:hypothetical protein
MNLGRFPIDEQLVQFRAALGRNQTLTEVLARAPGLGLPGWYLVAGCLYQTVWNVVTGRPPEAGILDYDLAYFDASDLSWEAEDAVIQAGHQAFSERQSRSATRRACTCGMSRADRGPVLAHRLRAT